MDPGHKGGQNRRQAPEGRPVAAVLPDFSQAPKLAASSQKLVALTCIFANKIAACHDVTLSDAYFEAGSFAQDLVQFC
jgi:hypothetical protein